MLLRCYLTLLLSFFGGFLYSQSFNKESLYDAISSDDPQKIDQQLEVLENKPIEGKEAYQGALLMKKAGYLKGAKEKLSFFKKGNKLLEKAIAEDNTNGEYRFLRLIIQENAPSVLKYNKDIEEDKSFIKQAYSSLPGVVQVAIRDYSKKSKVLTIKD